MFMSGKFHGQRNLEGCSPSDCRVRHYLTTEHNIVQTPPCYCSRKFSSPQEESLYNLNLLQHHSSKALILRCSAFFTVQLSHPYVTTGKSIALTRQTFVGKIMSLLCNILSKLVITFLPRSKRLLISWLQSPSAVISEPP